METEIWIDIPQFEELYQVSNFGRVRSNRKILSSKSPRYAGVVLMKNNKRNSYSVHRLVATMFVPNPDNKKEVNHIDGNKLNNHADNLEWCSPSENKIHAIRIGLVKKSGNASKLTEENVREIRILLSGKMTIPVIAKKFNCGITCIKNIKYNKSWKTI